MGQVVDSKYESSEVSRTTLTQRFLLSREVVSRSAQEHSLAESWSPEIPLSPWKEEVEGLHNWQDLTFEQIKVTMVTKIKNNIPYGEY